MTLGQWEDIWRIFCEYSFWTECHGFYVVPWGRLWMIWVSLYGKLLWWKVDYISWWEIPFWKIILMAKMSKKFPFLENFSRSGFPFWEFFWWLKCQRISFFGKISTVRMPKISFFGNFPTVKMLGTSLFGKIFDSWNFEISFLGILIAKNSERNIQKRKFWWSQMSHNIQKRKYFDG